MNLNWGIWKFQQHIFFPKSKDGVCIEKLAAAAAVELENIHQVFCLDQAHAGPMLISVIISFSFVALSVMTFILKKVIVNHLRSFRQVWNVEVFPEIPKVDEISKIEADRFEDATPGSFPEAASYPN